MAGLYIRSHCKKRMHEETNEDEEDKLEEEMSPQLSRIRSGEAGPGRGERR